MTDSGAGRPSAWPVARGAIRDAIAAKTPDDALDLLAPWFGPRHPELSAHDDREALALLTGLLAAAPEDPGRDRLLLAGSRLIDRGRQAMAADVLGRAVEAAPDDAKLLAELVAALELDGRHQEAIDYLERVPALVGSDPLLAYLRAFNAILVGDLQAPRDWLPRIRAGIDDTFRFMAARIERMLGRADAVRPVSGLSAADRRGWHFVLTGGLLLSEDSGAPGNGDSYRRVRGSVESLAAVLETWKLAPARVLSPPERHSEVLAHLVALTIGRPTAKWLGEAEPGLLVVYDPDDLVPELWGATKIKAAGQTLFVHMMRLARENRVAPDVLTGRYLRSAPPWGPGFDADDAYVAPVEDPPETLAQAIVQSRPDDHGPDELLGLKRFAQAISELPPALRPTALQSAGEREPLWAGAR